MPHSNNVCYEFGDFSFNVNQRLLARDGVGIPLSPKASEILLVLLSKAGELVEKDYLMKEVWPDSFVEEGNLSQNIFTLRRALGDHRSDAEYIETVVRRGYRFIAAVKLQESGNEFEPEARTESRPIIAVLPFVNATEDHDLEYVAEAIGENLIKSLSQISMLRVMSRSSVLRYRDQEVDPKKLSSDLKVDAILIGRVARRKAVLLVGAELVNANGWLLWGDSFECEPRYIDEIQDEIVRQISVALQLRLTGEEVRRIAARYTKSASAYQRYIEARFHWSRYTRIGLENAINHFRDAIEIDPNYALAYSGLVDCYLRLITNYLPPEQKEDSPTAVPNVEVHDRTSDEVFNSRVRLRHEWDWKGAERELRRANELKADYPAAHQWHAAYLLVRQLYDRSINAEIQAHGKIASSDSVQQNLSSRIPSAQLTPSEEVQVLCTIAREQIDVGNYEAASIVLKRWWVLGSWPKLTALNSQSSADLLFTTGELAGFVASADQSPIGQKNAEALLSGSIALFDQLGSAVRASEGRVELAHCYYRQGNFDLGRSTLLKVLDSLSTYDTELIVLALIRLAALERQAGRPQDALLRLQDAERLVKDCGPWVTGRHHLELASTFKDLASSENDSSLFKSSLYHQRQSLYQFEAIGNLRLLAIAENNLGFLLLTLGRLKSAEAHLSRARKVFGGLADRLRQAQVDDTLARLYLEQGRFDLAHESASRAIETLQQGDEDPLLAEVLRTKGIVCCRLQRFNEAGRILERAHDVAARCGDREGAGCALLIMIEQVGSHLTVDERHDIGIRLRLLLSESQQASTRIKLKRALQTIK